MNETTLILLKPDCVEKQHCGDVISRFEKIGLVIRGAKVIQLTPEVLSEHYAHVADKPFYPEIQKFMTRCPVIALAVSGENVIERTRNLLGPTDSTQAPAGTIRGDFGVDKMVNVAHASDSPENAEIELKRFFNAGEIV